MREAAGALLKAVPGEAAEVGGAGGALRYRFDDVAARRWIEYRPRPRPGLCLDDLDRAGRKAAHRLLATALSPHAYAQAMVIIALEEVLDRQEGWRRQRHSNDYYVAIFGDPARNDPWGWRFEGHHLSVTMTVVDGAMHPAPIFFGANPGVVSYQGRPVVAPLALEEELARALLDEMGPQGRELAIVGPTAVDDIISASRPKADNRLEPIGVPDHELKTSARALLDQLVAIYLDRLPADLARAQADRLRPGALSFAWQGPTEPGAGHYYRIQGPDLLIEYDNTLNAANHPHTVLRRPDGDFGGNVLAAHLADSHGAEQRPASA
jgi:hypothetical protein